VLCWSGSYGRGVSGRLSLLADSPDRQNILVQLRRERGLTSEGGFRLPVVWFNRLVLQSGVTLGFTKLALFAAIAAVIAFVGVLVFRNDLVQAIAAMLFAGLVMRLLGLM